MDSVQLPNENSNQNRNQWRRYAAFGTMCGFLVCMVVAQSSPDFKAFQPRALRTAEPTWTEIGAKLECDGYDGEVYLESSRGQVPTLAACKASCESSKDCQSISYFKSGWCTHWGTPCKKTKRNNKVVVSLRLTYHWYDSIAAPIKSIIDASKAKGIDVSAKAVSFVLDYDKKERKKKEGENLSLKILPKFTVFNLTKAEPILAEFVRRTRNEEGCLYYGWSLSEDGKTLICEEIYVDAAAIDVHLANIGELIAPLTAEGVAKMDSIALHGPSGEVDKLRATFDSFNAEYYITDSSIQNMKGIASKITSRPLDPVIIRPYFTVTDWEKARPIMAEFVRKTSTETRMIYYGWDVSGDKLFCREAYLDAEAASLHLANIGDLIAPLTAEGVAVMDSISIVGPAAELEKLKPGTASFGTVYFPIHSGFQQYA